MRSLTDSLIGVIAQHEYRIEMWNMSAPKLAVTNERWVYITKKHHNGDIGERSIGLPESDLPELIKLLGQITHFTC
ncbi:hypothetical protein [Candidatus Nitrotoga sp. AM1P]|uniref:hypothetical protein n=1 Tax=Candidatus Nitrotoga sp. AM1P TaxID=2559597 RepID=UPI0010B6A96F|nr:hypothetical protein [Candidatus Nitrotoga sp. AM1P]BBJ24223.1 hypothetical protein W01_21500 [Candidatus Nitrotoga sp. AM1P]